jgi:hypothetical protein
MDISTSNGAKTYDHPSNDGTRPRHFHITMPTPNASADNIAISTPLTPAPP